MKRREYLELLNLAPPLGPPDDEWFEFELPEGQPMTIHPLCMQQSVQNYRDLPAGPPETAEGQSPHGFARFVESHCRVAVFVLNVGWCRMSFLKPKLCPNCGYELPTPGVAVHETPRGQQAAVAQPVERRARDPVVPGSIPGGGLPAETRPGVPVEEVPLSVDGAKLIAGKPFFLWPDGSYHNEAPPQDPNESNGIYEVKAGSWGGDLPSSLPSFPTAETMFGGSPLDEPRSADRSPMLSTVVADVGATVHREAGVQENRAIDEWWKPAGYTSPAEFLKHWRLVTTITLEGGQLMIVTVPEEVPVR